MIRDPKGAECARTLRDLLPPDEVVALARRARVCSPDCTLGELTQRQRADIAKRVA